MKIRPLHNGIIFKFEDEIDRNAKSGFKDTSDGGIYLGVDMDRSTKRPRWGVVVSVGTGVIDDGIKPGARICIEALMWTNETVISGESIWKTDEDQVLLVA